MALKKTKKKAQKKIDVEELIGELNSRLDAMGEKLDTLLSRTAVITRMISTERDSDFKTRATVTKKFPIPQDNSGPRERKMHKVVCAECKKDCEVPFVPKANRPVYCKACFSNRRKDTGPGRNLPDREEIAREIVKTLKIDIAEPSIIKADKPTKNKNKSAKLKKAKPDTSKTKKSKSKVSKAKKPKAKKTKSKK